MNKKRYDAMTRDELAEATAEFDREFVVDTFAEPSPSARATLQQAQRKPGRPRTGKGAKVISVSVETDLLEKTDKLAASKGVSRARLIARGLRAVLAAEAPKQSRTRRAGGSK